MYTSNLYAMKVWSRYRCHRIQNRINIDSIMNELILWSSLECDKTIKLVEVILDQEDDKIHAVMEYAPGGAIVDDLCADDMNQEDEATSTYNPQASESALPTKLPLREVCQGSVWLSSMDFKQLKYVC